MATIPLRSVSVQDSTSATVPNDRPRASLRDRWPVSVWRPDGGRVPNAAGADSPSGTEDLEGSDRPGRCNAGAPAGTGKR